MNSIRVILFLLLLFSFNSVLSQEKKTESSGTGPTQQSLKSKRKQLKAERKEAREKRKAEKAERKAVKKYHKKIQTKKVRKRMKQSKKMAKMNNENTRQPFFKRWFTMRRKV